jgi:hypothetical protein
VRASEEALFTRLFIGFRNNCQLCDSKCSRYMGIPF